MTNPLLPQIGLHLGPYARISGPNGDRWLNPHELVKAENQILHGKFKNAVGAAAFRANRLATRVWLDAAQSENPPPEMPALIHLNDHGVKATVAETLDLGIPDRAIGHQSQAKNAATSGGCEAALNANVSLRLQRLERLAKLHESKTISAEEFDDLKQAVLRQVV